MPGGQYFYTNPNAAAIANNVAKLFFGDPEAAQQQAQQEQMRLQSEGLGLKNQLTQQQVLDQQGLHTDRGMLGNLFGSMRTPEDYKMQAPAIAAILARNAGMAGAASPEDIAKTALFSAANSGLGDETVGNAYVGSGHTLGVNDAVSISGQDRIRNLNQENDMAKVGAQEAAANSRNAATIAGLNYRQTQEPINVGMGDSVFMRTPEGGVMPPLTSDPAAIAADRATKERVESVKTPNPMTPAAAQALRAYIIKDLPSTFVQSDSIDGQALIADLVQRAGQYIAAGYDAVSAAAQAKTDILKIGPNGQLATEGGGWFDGDPRLVRQAVPNVAPVIPRAGFASSMPNAPASALSGPPASSEAAYPVDTAPIGEVFAPTDPNMQGLDINGLPIPPHMQQQPGMTTQGGVPEGTRRTYKGKNPALQGVVQIYQNGAWVTQNAPAP